MLRFAAKYAKLPDGCWQWSGASSVMSKTQNREWRYGWFRPGGRATHILAHRWSYEAHREKIPAGKVIDHLCRNTLCVNPDHLEPVTVKVNLNRGANANARKTHCKRGHLFDADNTYIGVRGTRFCRKCKAWHQRRYNAEKQA
jgi:hypothetical protein